MGQSPNPAPYTSAPPSFPAPTHQGSTVNPGRNDHHRHNPSIPPGKKCPEAGQISHTHKSQLYLVHPACHRPLYSQQASLDTASGFDSSQPCLPHQKRQLWHPSQLRQNKTGPSASLSKPSSSRPALTAFGFFCLGHSLKMFF